MPSKGYKKTPQTRCKRGHEFTPENTYKYEYRGRTVRSCRRCRAMHAKKWATPENNRDRNLRRSYGFDDAGFQERVAQQNGKCGICGTDITKMRRFLVHVDHDKQTGGVRGILCRKCNTGLGHFGDSIEGLRRAIRYLESTITM